MRPGAPREAGEPEVEDLGAARGEHHVRRLQVAVNDAERMHLGQRIGDAQPQVDRLADRQRTARQTLLQSLALDALHDQIRPAVRSARVVNRHDRGMVDARRRARSRISRSTASRSSLRWRGSSLIATLRGSWVSSASHTSPIAPRPSGSRR